jgi:glycerophosphoryl diester phosphodiesterase
MCIDRLSSRAYYGWASVRHESALARSARERLVGMMREEVIMPQEPNPPYPKNAPGPFYVENECCFACEAPYHEAPDLMAHDEEGIVGHCYFKKQPSTPDEVERAISACIVSCVGAVRYGGNDPAVLERFRELRAEEAADVLAGQNRFLALLRSAKASPVIVAHRGDSFHAPENTLEAARLGWAAGAEAWELDVQLTRDGVPVVLHDESLLRTTDVATRFAGDPRGRDGFRVSDFDFDEVRTLDAGSWFVDPDGGPRSARDFGTLDRLDPADVAFFRSGQVFIPTLVEALLVTKEQDWLVNVEIKSFPEHPPGLVERVLEVIAATGTAERVLISSFDHGDVVEADRDGRRHALGILLATPLYRIDDYAGGLVGADTVHVSTEVLGSDSVAYRRDGSARSLRHDVIAVLKEKGIPVLVYTVNHQASGTLARHLAEIEVDGLFTDDPRGLKDRFEAIVSTGPRA